ncbi:hypothetical protein B0H19DRAFT_6990 [Mycena capillaripes]|nr:hypothetical protein B0H19DRAFT_6990 [Mycena capillaripes]
MRPEMPRSCCWKCGAPPLNSLPSISDVARLSADSPLNLNHLLTSNEAPTEAEISPMRLTISEMQDQVDALDAEIYHLRTTLGILFVRRQEAVDLVCQHSAILSPVRRVPPELICEIFAWTLDRDDEGAASRPPWHLGHICHSWRNAALAYPHLWRSISIPSLSHPSEDVSLRLMIECLLLRSGNASLDVLLQGVQMNTDLLDLIFAHCARWRVLRLDGFSTTAELDCLRPLMGHLPRLERVEAARMDGTTIPDIFSGAPNLQQVMLCDWKFQNLSWGMTIPWRQVTHYRGAGRPEPQLEIFRAAPNLRECAIDFLDTSVEPRGNTPVILPRLRRFCIRLARFLVYLKAPSLEELFCVESHIVDTYALLPFVRSSSCSLRKLVLANCNMPMQLIAVLRGLPYLTYLLIETDSNHHAETEYALFTSMTMADTSRDVCPDLSTLVYGFNNFFARDAFLAMARTRLRRNPLGPQLERLLFFDAHHHRDTCPVFMTAAIDSLRHGGLDVLFLDQRAASLLKGKEFFS